MATTKPVIDTPICAYVNGEWIKGKTPLVSTNPADTRDVVARCTEAGKEEVRQAAAAARAAQKKWAQTPAPIRAGMIQNFGKLVEANKDALARLVTREVGKPLRESHGSVQEVVDTVNFFVSEGRRLYGQTIPSEMPNKELFTYRRPIGVFGCMTACNFPVAVPAWYFVPALVAGNVCVWKPSEESVAIAWAMTELIAKAGFPRGVFNTVFGGGPTTGAAFVDLIDEGAFDKVGFTGSTAVGRRIGEACGKALQTPCLELGGKNPMVVCADADLDLVLEGTIFSGYATGGQRCTSLGNLILEDKIHDRFVEMLTKKVQSLKIGDPNKAHNTYGPLISERFLKSHVEHLATLVEKHHELPLGKGGRIGHGVSWDHFDGDAEHGLYARPNFVLNVKKTDKIYSTETFGPLFNVMKFSDFGEAISMANDHGYGLSSSIYTNDPKRAYQYKTEITAGMTSINNSTTGAEAHVPFGGNGKSGNGGRQSGIWVLDQFTKWQAVNWDLSGKLQMAQMDTAYVEPELGFRLA
jgi:aldehyde dehydrogenase (NAD+)